MFLFFPRLPIWWAWFFALVSMRIFLFFFKKWARKKYIGDFYIYFIFLRKKRKIKK